MKKLVVMGLLGLGCVASCTRIPPVRILPASINSVYVPIFENLSYEPGVEEKLTRLTVEEFLSDGRLDVVRWRNADVVVVGKLRKFSTRMDRLGRDDFPITSRIFAIADVELYDPSDRERKEPLMSWRDIDVEYSYISDVRRVVEISPEDAFEEALQRLARRIVATVITSRPEEAEELRAAAVEPKPAVPRRELGREEFDTRLVDRGSTEPLEPDDE